MAVTPTPVRVPTQWLLVPEFHVENLSPYLRTEGKPHILITNDEEASQITLENNRNQIKCQNISA